MRLSETLLLRFIDSFSENCPNCFANIGYLYYIKVSKSKLGFSVTLRNNTPLESQPVHFAESLFKMIDTSQLTRQTNFANRGDI